MSAICKEKILDLRTEDYENAEKIHFSGLYTEEYPGLEYDKIIKSCELLNNI